MSNKDVWGCPSKGHGHLCTSSLSRETEGEKEKKYCVRERKIGMSRERQKEMNKVTNTHTHMHTDFPLCRNLIPFTVTTRTPTDPNHDLRTRRHDCFTDYINKALLAGKAQFLGYFIGW